MMSGSGETGWPLERLLRDPLWWLGVLCWLLVFFAVLRIPTLDLQPASTSLPVLWTLMPGLAFAGGFTPFVLTQWLLSLFLAIGIPGLLFRGTTPAAHPLHPEVAALPGLFRLRVLRAVGEALVLSALLLLLSGPLAMLLVKARNVSGTQVLWLAAHLLAQPLWITALWALCGSPGRSHPNRALLWALLVLLLTFGLTYALFFSRPIEPWRLPYFHLLLAALLLQGVRMHPEWPLIRPRTTTLGVADVSS